MLISNKIISNLNEASFKFLSGKNIKPLSETLGREINKLNSMLREYGIDLSHYPIKEAPDKLIYLAYTSNDEPFRIEFIQGLKQTKDYSNADEVSIIITYKGEREIAGVVNLNDPDSIEEAFELITMTLENLGLLDFNDNKEEPKEVNSELDDLARFNNR